MESELPEETLLELLEYANNVVFEEQEKRVSKLAEQPQEDNSGSVLKKETPPAQNLTSQERVRYRHIGQELFAGGQRRLEEIKRVLDFRRKMGRVFDKFTDVKLNFSVAQKVSYAAKDAVTFFKTLFVSLVTFRVAFRVLAFVCPLGVEQLKVLLSPELGFLKEYWNKAKDIYDKIAKSLKNRVVRAGFGDTKVAQAANILVEEFGATFSLVYDKLKSLYNNIVTDELTVLIETLSWATIGGMVGGPWGAAIGAVAGFIIGCLEVDDAAKQRMQTVNAVMNIQVTAKSRQEQAQEEIDRLEGEIAFLQQRVVNTGAAALRKKRKLEELQQEVATLRRKKKMLEFSSKMETNFWYGTLGEQPKVVQILEKLGYVKDVDFRLGSEDSVYETDSDGKEHLLGRVTYVKDIFGIPLNTDGDTSAIMARLDRESQERYGAEMWGSIYEKDVNAFLHETADRLGGDQKRKNTMENKVLYDNKVMKDSVEGLYKYMQGACNGMNAKITAAKKEEKAAMSVEVLTESERWLLEQQEKRVGELLERIKGGAPTLVLPREVMQTLQMVLDYYAKNTTRGPVEKIFASALMQAKSIFKVVEAQSPKLSVAIKSDNDMVNIITIREVDKMPDIEKETEIEDMQKTAKNIYANRSKIIKALQDRRNTKNAPTPKKQETPKNPAVSLNLSVIPFARAVLGENSTIVENTEAIVNNRAFDQPGSNFGYNGGEGELNVII